MNVPLDEFLDREVLPALFDRLDTAFPEYGFRRRGSKWEATADATRALPGQPRPDRVHCYSNRRWGLVIEGGDFVRFLDLVNGGAKPTGADFVEAVRDLARRAGVAFPEREQSPEDIQRSAQRNSRRSALDVLVALCRETLTSAAGAEARAYLESRGIDAAAQDALGVGLYPSKKAVVDALRGTDNAVADVLAMERMAGYVVFPWADAQGQPLTLYGRWPGMPPQGLPKTLALGGEGTKASPLYLDRALQAGHKDLVLVEGLFDAALLQAREETDTVACMGAQFNAAQLDTLARHSIASVTICLDPDGAGEAGTLACIRGLYGKGIKAYVAPVLPGGMDPDEFVLAHGIEAWREHLNAREHAFRFKARTMCTKHMSEQWTDKTLADCLDEAIAFDDGVQDPAHATDLDLFFWPEVVRFTGADMVAVQARVTAARDKAQADRERRVIAELLREADDKLRAGDLGGARDLLRDQLDKMTRETVRGAEPVRNLADELEAHEAHLAKFRGREFIGLPQRTLGTLDKKMLGLRGLMLLAASPNAGKTALGLQLGVDVVVHNSDACFLFVSLEMSRSEMMTRIKSRLSDIPYRDLVFGARGGLGVQEGSFTKHQWEALNKADATLRDIGQRIRILDDKNFPAPTFEKVLAQVEDLKATSGASRVFILVDYLQVWPVPDNRTAIRSDLDADKWRIEQMRRLRDAVGSENPVMVISEARKPSDSDGAWAGGLSDVMGSARGTYTPDVVLLLAPLSDMERVKLEDPGFSQSGNNRDDRAAALREKATELRERDERAGYAAQRLRIVKGRDGVERGEIDVCFYFARSVFTEQEGGGR